MGQAISENHTFIAGKMLMPVRCEHNGMKGTRVSGIPGMCEQMRVAGVQGVIRLTPMILASAFVETSLSPCMSTTNGFLSSSSMIRVFTKECSSRPSCRDPSAVPPRSTYA